MTQREKRKRKTKKGGDISKVLMVWLKGSYHKGNVCLSLWKGLGIEEDGGEGVEEGPKQTPAIGTGRLHRPHHPPLILPSSSASHDRTGAVKLGACRSAEPAHPGSSPWLGDAVTCHREGDLRHSLYTITAYSRSGDALGPSRR